MKVCGCDVIPAVGVALEGNRGLLMGKAKLSADETLPVIIGRAGHRKG